MPQRCVVGVDLGGTNVRACAYLEDGTEAGPRFERLSKAQDGSDAVFEAVSAVVLDAAKAASAWPSAVGVAFPGHIDDTAGVVYWTPNFGSTLHGVYQHWTNLQVRQPLENLIGLPVSLGNDANLAALGEYRFGTGKNRARCLVMVTLGTGIGGGVVLSPQSVLGDARGPLLLLGGNKGGVELGHTVINSNGLDCNAGSYGALEAYCGRDAIVQRAWHRIKRERPTVLVDMVGGDLSLITPKLIADAAHQGDEVACEVYEEVGTMLGVGLGNFVNIFCPDILAVGGQIAKAGDVLLKPAFRSARNVSIPSLLKDVRFTVAEQIDDAGMLGGAALALERLEHGPSV